MPEIPDTTSPAADSPDPSGASPETVDVFRLTFEHAAIGIMHMGLGGDILRANAHFCALTGYTEAELKALPKWKLASAEDRDEVRRQFGLLREGAARDYSGERVYITRDGRALPVWVSARLAPGPTPETSCIVVIVEDLSARKATEEALRKSEERFRLAMKGADEGLWDWNIAAGTTYLSPRWKSMLGYQSDEIEDTPESWEPLLAPGMREVLGRQIAALEAGETDTYEIELKIRHKDGHWVDILSRAFPLFDENRRMIRLVGTHRDITERKRHETELRRAATVFESTHEGIVVTDPEGRIVMVNPAFERITGYGEGDVLGSRMSALQSGRHAPDFYQTMWREIHEVGHWQGEIWNRRKNGAIYPEWLTISAVRDTEGEIVNYVGLFTDIGQLKQSQARLDFLAHHDPLTSLPNRLFLRERIDRAIESGLRESSLRAILFLDLDRFKTINDSLGHAIGDELLMLVAERWRRRLRSTDLLARLGGDEFVVLLEPLDSPEAAVRVASDLIADVTRPFIFSDGREGYVGLSIGVVTFPSGATTADALIQQADSALYASKEAGGGVIRFYSPAQTEAARMRLEMESGLRRALERGELALQYQPQVELPSRRICGVEALVRWRSPQGLISPAQFIPTAEKTGLIIPLGEWVLREACSRMRAWLDAGVAIDSLAVNLSPRQLDRADITDRIHGILSDTGLEPGRLEIEITEGALMEQGRNAVRKLEALKALGLRIAVDDFGTGYSSLAYLKRFPIDRLKLDRSFIIDIPADPTSMEIAAAVIRLSKSLNVETIAEGVETEAQSEFLARSGCAFAQGFLFARPMWEEDLTRWVARGEAPRSAVA